MNEIIDAIAEWDDRGQTFRVYLTREGQGESEPMEARLTEETIESRLYRAALCASVTATSSGCAKDPSVRRFRSACREKPHASQAPRTVPWAARAALNRRAVGAR